MPKAQAQKRALLINELSDGDMEDSLDGEGDPGMGEDMEIEGMN